MTEKNQKLNQESSEENEEENEKEEIEIVIPLEEEQNKKEEKEEEVQNNNDEDEWGISANKQLAELKGKEVEIEFEESREGFAERPMPHAGEEVSSESIKRELEAAARGEFYFIYDTLRGEVIPLISSADVDASRANLSFGKIMVKANFLEDEELRFNFFVEKRGEKEGVLTPLNEAAIEAAFRKYTNENKKEIREKISRAKERLLKLEEKI